MLRTSLLLSLALVSLAVSAADVQYRCGADSYVTKEEVPLAVTLVRSGDLTQPTSGRVWAFSSEGEPWAAPLVVPFAPGQSEATVEYNVNDNGWRGDRTGVLRCMPLGVESIGGISSLTIDEDEPFPTLSAPLSWMGYEGAMSYIDLRWSPPALVDLPVTVRSVHGTTSENDFAYLPSVQSKASSGETTFKVFMTDDAVIEETETFTLVFEGPGISEQVAVSIIDDDANTFHLSLLSAVVNENAGITASVVRSTGTDGTGTATIRVTPTNPARQPPVAPVTVEFAKGERSKMVPLPVDDALYGGDRSVIVEVYENDFMHDSETAWISEDEPVPSPVLHDAQAREAAGGSQATFLLTISPAWAGDAHVDLSTAERTATAGKDFTSVSRTTTVPGGESSAPITVVLLDDALQEEDEQFILTAVVRGPYGGEPVVLQASGTIRDDEGPERVLLPDGGWFSAGRPLTLTFDAGVSGSRAQTVTLQSSDPAVVTVPSAVTLGAGRRTVAFEATAGHRGSAQITARPPSGQSAIATVNVFEEHQILASPSRIDAPAASVSRLWLSLVPASEDDVTVSLASANPGVLELPGTAVIPANGSVEVDVRPIRTGSTSIEVRLPPDHGATTLAIPASFVAPGRVRAIRR